MSKKTCINSTQKKAFERILTFFFLFFRTMLSEGGVTKSIKKTDHLLPSPYTSTTTPTTPLYTTSTTTIRQHTQQPKSGQQHNSRSQGGWVSDHGDGGLGYALEGEGGEGEEGCSEGQEFGGAGDDGRGGGEVVANPSTSSLRLEEGVEERGSRITTLEDIYSTKPTKPVPDSSTHTNTNKLNTSSATTSRGNSAPGRADDRASLRDVVSTHHASSEQVNESINSDNNNENTQTQVKNKKVSAANNGGEKSVKILNDGLVNYENSNSKKSGGRKSSVSKLIARKA